MPRTFEPRVGRTEATRLTVADKVGLALFTVVAVAFTIRVDVL